MPKYILDEFNDLCTELGIQCLITMNTRDYQLDYLFQNVGTVPVALFTDDWFQIINPSGQLTIKMPSQDSPWMAQWPDEEVDREFHILPIPPIVPEAWKFIKEAQQANRTLAEKAKDETSDFENEYPF